MANDFFDGLGETISRTARELSEKAENFYEVQKLRNQISGEERVVSKAMETLGRLIYKRYESGEAVDDEIAGICGEISKHMNKINELKGSAAGKAGQKICPSCHRTIDREVLYCPYCGTPCENEADTCSGEEPKEEAEFQEAFGLKEAETASEEKAFQEEENISPESARENTAEEVRASDEAEDSSEQRN